MGNIAIFPLDNWNEKIQRLQNDPDNGLQLIRNLREFASPEQKMEANGRIKINDELLEIADIKDKVILKGEGNYISVWNPEKYKEYRRKRIKEHIESFDSIDYQK